MKEKPCSTIAHEVEGKDGDHEGACHVSICSLRSEEIYRVGGGGNDKFLSYISLYIKLTVSKLANFNFET